MDSGGRVTHVQSYDALLRHVNMRTHSGRAQHMHAVLLSLLNLVASVSSYSLSSQTWGGTAIIRSFTSFSASDLSCKPFQCCQ